MVASELLPVLMNGTPGQGKAKKERKKSIYLSFKYVYGIILDFLAMTPVDLRILVAACKQEHTSNRAESDQNFNHSKALSI